MTVIIDYDCGNLRSIANMLKKIGAKATISRQKEDIERAERLILPGVGAFDYGMSKLQEFQLCDLLTHRAMRDRIPILGICLGMQLMTQGSAEGTLPGLGWFDGACVRFGSDNDTFKERIPHMGWNSVLPTRQTALLSDSYAEHRFYFVHSYHFVPSCAQDSLGETHYAYNFTSLMQKDNLTGAQFHPEKSHKFGQAFLANWLA